MPPEYDLSQRLKAVEAALMALATSPSLLNASTGQGGGNPGITIDTNGVHAYNSAGTNIVGMLTQDGSITAYDSSGNPVARFGPLTNSNPGNYGIEVKYNGAWAQVGAGNVDWSNISNKPSTFPPSAHSHAGTDITSAVGQANGSQQAYSNPVPGTSFFAVWVGNAAGYLFGTNTSSARYKRKIRRHRIDPKRVLALRPVRYEKPSNGDYTEYGLIAEQVLEAGVPELVQWMDGRIHGLRYDLLAVALLEVVKEQEKRIAALEKGETHTTSKPWHEPEHQANNPPPHPETPHPYTIEED
jgi:hypothetical protein